MIHIVKDILKENIQVYIVFLWHLRGPQVLNITYLMANSSLEQLFDAFTSLS